MKVFRMNMEFFKCKHTAFVQTRTPLNPVKVVQLEESSVR